MARLICCSFHSVKGGVGKSTLATWTAVELARATGRPVYLLDMDLTGTSLADVLPLQAPALADLPGGRGLDLRAEPAAEPYSLQETRDRIERRGERLREAPNPCLVPFLNDFLLYATPSWEEAAEANPGAFLWRLQGGPESLRVIPSSALPEDLEQILQVVYDENHSAFLEGRLECLLAGLAQDVDEAYVVVDTPPTIPGLSRAVISLALRLGNGTDKKPLALDGLVPVRLQEAELTWQIFLVTSEDGQDLRAANRWCQLVQVDEERQFQVVINKPAQEEPSSAEIKRRQHLDLMLPTSTNPLIRNPCYVDDAPELRFFRRDAMPDGLPELPAFLLKMARV